MKNKKPGLWANIRAKKKRIKAGSGERMNKPGDKGYPKASAIKASQKKRKKKWLYPMQSQGLRISPNGK